MAASTAMSAASSIAFSLQLRQPPPPPLFSLRRAAPAIAAGERRRRSGSESISPHRLRLYSSSRSSPPPQLSQFGAGDEEDREAAAMGKLKGLLAARRAAAAGGGSGPADLVRGVAEEIGDIEWPEFRRVLGTTGVVLAVIAGSTVALLVVNAILAEICGRLFSGTGGVQDFFLP